MKKAYGFFVQNNKSIKMNFVKKTKKINKYLKRDVKDVWFFTKKFIYALTINCIIPIIIVNM